ncbi:thymidine kinase [Candidatus Babeliales bacterium]|nr:thymidine kinase [Candidatus Babeliales bacterium]
MFSGKTEDLMRRLRRAEFAKKQVITIKPRIDNRKSITCIVSHDGNEREAELFDHNDDLFDSLLEMCKKPEIDIIGIDEIQFFSQKLIPVIQSLVKAGKRVITAGLDLDFRGEPFPTTSHLLALADYVTKHKAVCIVCGSNAHHTQRLIDGAPARYEDPIIMVGSEEKYQARCRTCFTINKQDQNVYILLATKQEQPACQN